VRPSEGEGPALPLLDFERFTAQVAARPRARGARAAPSVRPPLWKTRGRAPVVLRPPLAVHLWRHKETLVDGVIQNEGICELEDSAGSENELRGILLKLLQR
jgi:hypothetical protein